MIDVKWYLWYDLEIIVGLFDCWLLKEKLIVVLILRCFENSRILETLKLAVSLWFSIPLCGWWGLKVACHLCTGLCWWAFHSTHQIVNQEFISTLQPFDRVDLSLKSTEKSKYDDTRGWRVIILMLVSPNSWIIKWWAIVYPATLTQVGVLMGLRHIQDGLNFKNRGVYQASIDTKPRTRTEGPNSPQNGLGTDYWERVRTGLAQHVITLAHRHNNVHLSFTHH